MRKRLYKVEQAIWGAYNTTTLYFETKAEAEGYVANHDRCNLNGYVCPNEVTRTNLLNETSCYIFA